MALTPEQINEMRQKYKINPSSAPTKSSKAEPTSFTGTARDFATGFTKGLLNSAIGTARTLQTAGQGIIAAVDPSRNFKQVQEETGFKSLQGDTASQIDKDLESKNTAELTGKVAAFGAELLTPSGSRKVATKTIEAGSELIDDVMGVGKNIVDKVGNKIIPESTEIMNRVARLKPNDAKQFENLAGKTHGEYLTETGNFGTPDEIIKKEAAKFTRSKDTVDTELSKLPGTFEDGSIADALQGLAEKAKSTSGANVKSPYFNRVIELDAKHASKGLTMDEINEVKRLYERNVKLGYNKLVNGEKVEQATNIDNALREWQVKKAQELGFNNISELNKQTQLSRFVVDKLGEQLIGQNGLNGVNLTDWVMLSGGDPTAIAGFLTKKFFSSKSVQSKVAEFLNKGKDVVGDIKADVGASQVKQLPAGNPSVRSSISSDEVIPVAPTGRNIEITGKKGITPSKRRQQR